MIKVSTSRRIFLIVNTVFCIVVGIVCVAPVIHVLALSFSAKTPVESGNVYLWPVNFIWDNYELVVRDRQFYQSYLVSFLRVGLGWIFSIVMTVLAAYPMSMSRASFPGRKYFVGLFMGAMLFNGGLIPTYLVVDELGLIDTILALILPCCVGTYYIILTMNFMKGLPDAIQEAAYVDGANHIQTMARIVLPLCKPVLATVSLFIILQHWNSWFDGMVYIRKQSLKPLQTYLRSIVVVNSNIENESIEGLLSEYSTDGANAAKIFLAMIPVFCFYPFVQKYFIKGLTVGSVKE